MKLCKIDGCRGLIKSRGWCSKHYQRWRHHGDPLTLLRTEPGAPERFIEDVAILHEANECLIWPFSKNPAGYGKICINGRLEHANRVVCERVHGPAPSSEHQAAHSCGKGHMGCIAPMHLSWKTPSENAADKVVHGTHNRGEKHPLARLTAGDVIDIRRLRGHLTQQELAECYGVDRGHISLIQCNKTWRFVGGEVVA